MESSRELRHRLVELLVESRAIRSKAVRRAFLAVPRELFLPEIAEASGLDVVYSDEALPVQHRDGLPTSSSSQPTIMAEMLEALDLRGGESVLEIGLGTGYNAALLSRLVGPAGRVTSIDIDPGLAAKARQALADGGYAVTALAGDGHQGWADGAPYDRIIATASVGSVPRPWWDQLAPGGRLVVPLRIGAMQLVVVFARTPAGLHSTQLIPGGFMYMRPDADAPPQWLPTIAVGQEGEQISASGPAIAGLLPEARDALRTYLASAPQVEPVEPRPGLSPLWHAAVTTDPGRQVIVHSGWSTVRFGLVDPASGAICVLCVARQGAGRRRAARRHDVWVLDTIESYGPADALRSELLAALDSWTSAGAPAFDRLTLDVTYEGDRPLWGQRTDEIDGQWVTLGWT